MIINKDKNALKVLIVSVAVVMLTSCSKGPDPRLTLCQDLSQLFVDSKEQLEWTEHKAIIKGYQDLEMQVHFTATDTNGKQELLQASCFYPYEQDEIGAETFEMPTAAYSTYPVKMIFNGNNIDKKRLAQSINKVMIMQGKQAIKNIQEKLSPAQK